MKTRKRKKSLLIRTRSADESVRLEDARLEPERRESEGNFLADMQDAGHR